MGLTSQIATPTDKGFKIMARPKNENPGTRISVAIPSDVHEEIENFRWDARMTLPEFVNAALVAFLETVKTAKAAK